MTVAAAKMYRSFYIWTAKYKAQYPELEVNKDMYEEEDVTYAMITNPEQTWAEKKRMTISTQ